jgi:NAD(P)H dehydrogenase (quinone)
MSIVITGASGQLGRMAAGHVLDAVEPGEVVLVTRNPEQLDDLAARGAQVRKGDFDDPEELAGAFSGGERLLLISTDRIGARVPQHRNAIQAAEAAGIRFVAYTSIPNPSEDNPGMVVPDHRQTEELIRASSLDWVILRNSIYTQMRIPMAAEALASGRLVHNHGEGRIAHVSREDCAAAAAGAVVGGTHTGSVYDVTGPELNTAADLAEIFSQVGGRPVEAVAVDDEAMFQHMVDGGAAAAVAERLTSSGRALREGFLDVRTDVVEELSGRAPRTVREVLEEHRAQLG